MFFKSSERLHQLLATFQNWLIPQPPSGKIIDTFLQSATYLGLKTIGFLDKSVKL